MLALISALALSSWPAADAQLTVLELPDAGVQKTKKFRVVIDAGHGAPGNVGNHGCACQEEQGHTLVVADALAAALTATGRFDVLRTRIGSATPKYQARIAAAQAFKPDAIISIHSDARGEARGVDQGDGGVCWENPNAPGFSVLWNDEGAALAGREKLGRAVGARMREAGFLAYDGFDYSALYNQDTVERSGWIDKRPMKQRVYFLRATNIPTVIVETHHALDVTEVARWDEAQTMTAFAAAIARALLDP